MLGVNFIFVLLVIEIRHHLMWTWNLFELNSSSPFEFLITLFDVGQND